LFSLYKGIPERVLHGILIFLEAATADYADYADFMDFHLRILGVISGAGASVSPKGREKGEATLFFCGLAFLLRSRYKPLM
jgi:hypothetical protein